MSVLEESISVLRERCAKCVQEAKDCSEICLEAERKLERHYQLNSSDDRDAAFQLIYPAKA